jgi:hypothetical protein
MMSRLLMCHDKEGDMVTRPNDLERVPHVMPDESASRASVFGTSALGLQVFGTLGFRT